MRPAKSKGPPTRNRRRAPKRASWPGARSSVTAYQNFPQGEAPAGLVRRMQDAGAVFVLRTDAERRTFRYGLDYAADADRPVIGALLAQAKLDPDFLVLFRVAAFVAIMRAAWDLPEACW